MSSNDTRKHKQKRSSRDYLQSTLNRVTVTVRIVLQLNLQVASKLTNKFKVRSNLNCSDSAVHFLDSTVVPQSQLLQLAGNPGLRIFRVLRVPRRF